MTAELHDAHTRFNTQEQWENRKKHQGVSVGFRVATLEGKTVIVDVFPDSNAARAGIEPGMMITAVDGQPIAARLAEAEKKILPSSSERITRLRLLGAVFTAPIETPLTIGLQRSDGSTFEAKLARQILARPPQVTAAQLPSGFAYIRFDEFQHPLVKELKQALENLRTAPGLILDLRRNGGGDGATLQAMAGFFFNSKVPFEKRMSRKQVSASERAEPKTEQTEGFVGKNGEQIYAGPLVILVSENTGSAAELFAAGMQDNDRATILGGQTCGCVLGITHNRTMKGGGVLEISEILWFSPKGRKLEGEGVIPDKFAAPTIASLQEKRDPVLDAALKTLRELAIARFGASNP